MLIFFLIFPNVFSFSQYFTESYKPDHDNTGIFFVFFPLQKDFDICSGLFLAFLLFFFRNILISFTCFFSKPFFVSWIIFIYHFYIYKKKNYKTLVISYISVIFNFLHHNLLRQNLLHQNFLHQNFLYQNFIHQNFFIRIRRNFYIINIIMNNLFFFNNIFTFL